jgi:hypothetical protein
MWTRLRAAISRVAFAWSRRRLDDEAAREIDDHIDLLTARYVRQGMSHEDARSAARRQFGNVTIVREEIHEANGIGLLEHAARDLQYGFRQLRGSPGFTLVVAATLGLGIGGTTAVFSVVEAVLLKPLPYEEPGELVRFYQQTPGRPDTQGVLAGTHFTFLREHATAFDDVAAAANYSETGVDLATADGRVERLRVLRVSSGYFSTLQADPAPGRGFDRDDETGARRVVLSDRVWRAFYGADASVVGTTIVLSGEHYEVAGIAPRGF